MDPTSIPLDLAPIILEFVSRDEQEHIATLSRCALVCRSWKLPSQKLLFSVARPTLLPENWDAVSHLLSSSVHLGSMIVNLRIIMNYDLGYLRSASTALGLLPNIQNLTLQGRDDGRGHADAGDLAWLEQFVQQFSDLFRCRRHLRKITFHTCVLYFNFPSYELRQLLFDIKSCSLLQIINSLVIWREGLEPPPTLCAAAPHIKVEQLDLVASRAGIFTQGHEWQPILKDFDLGYVKRCTVYHNEEELCKAVEDMTSLQKLTIVSDNDGYHDHLVFLNKCPHLRELGFKYRLDVSGLNTMRMRWIIRSLQTLSNTNEIEILKFTILAINSQGKCPARDLKLFDADLFAGDWKDLARILASGNFPSLREISISTLGAAEGSPLSITWQDVSNLAVQAIKDVIGGHCPFAITSHAKELDRFAYELYLSD